MGGLVRVKLKNRTASIMYECTLHSVPRSGKYCVTISSVCLLFSEDCATRHVSTGVDHVMICFAVVFLQCWVSRCRHGCFAVCCLVHQIHAGARTKLPGRAGGSPMLADYPSRQSPSWSAQDIVDLLLILPLRSRSLETSSPDRHGGSTSHHLKRPGDEWSATVKAR